MDDSIMDIFILANNILIIIITILLIILYIKSRHFNKFAVYNMITLSVIVCLDNVLRIYPIKEEIKDEIEEGLKYTQAFFLVLFDKLLLTNITSQSIINYFGIVTPIFLSTHNTKIFIISLILNFVISIALTSAYTFPFELSFYKGYFYCADTEFKKIGDSIFNGVSIVVNVVFTIITLHNLYKMKKNEDKRNNESSNFSYFFWKSLIIFIINILTFVESYLLIYDLFFSDEIGDLLYIITCLLIDLSYNINQVIISQIKYIFCCKKKDIFIEHGDKLLSEDDIERFS